jgi:hypothetical protein
VTQLQYNNESGTLGAALNSTGTTITFTLPPDFATITGSDYIVLALDEGTNSYEIVHLTAYTAGASTGTITRAAEDSSHWPATTHQSGAAWTNAPTVATFGTYAPQILPSGDSTGATDTAAIQALLTGGVASLGKSSKTHPFYINAQLVVPDGTNGTVLGGLLVGQGVDSTVIRVANGANLTGPAITDASYALTGSSAPTRGNNPVFVKGFTLDMNAQNQTYAASPAWATLSSGEFPANGPDGVTILDPLSEVTDVLVVNPIRHGFVSVDQTAGGGNAGSNAYDQRWDRLRVDGYYGPTVPLASIPTLSCTTTAGANTITTTSVPTGVIVGSVPFGAGMAPNTVVTNVTGPVAGTYTITLNQKAIASGTSSLVFGLGMRQFWNTNFSGYGSTNGYLGDFIGRYTFGDWSIKNDNASGWTNRNPHTYGSAYSGWRFMYAEQTITDIGPGTDYANFGTPPSLPMATVNQTLTGGTAYTSITVQALNVALPLRSVLVLRGAGTLGAPVYVSLSAAAAVGATTISVNSFTPFNTLVNPVLYQPYMGMLTYQSVFPTPVGLGTILASEVAGADYLYTCFIGSSSGPFALDVTKVSAQNYSVTNGTTSCAAAFIGNGGTWTITGAASIINNARGTITTPYSVSGTNVVTAVPYDANGAAEAIFGNSATGATMAAVGVNALTSPAVPDAAGGWVNLASVVTPAYVAQPTAIFLPNGNIAVAYRYVASGSDTSGAGSIYFGVFDEYGNQIVAPASVAVDVNATQLDCRQPLMTILADGRLLLVFATCSASTGNPNGMNGGSSSSSGATNPDGKVGNCRYIIGSISGNTVTWVGGATPTQNTIVSGISGSAGFDYVGATPVWEPSTGNLIFAMCGSNTSATFATSDIIFYLVGTYSAGTGIITWSTYTSGTTIPALAASELNEPSLAPVYSTSTGALTGFNVLYRNNTTAEVVQVNGSSGTIAQLLAGTVSWGSAAAMPTVGTQANANPNQLSLSTGEILFMSRATSNYYLGANPAVLCSSSNGGTSWSIQDLDDDLQTIYGNGFNYGQLLQVPGNPSLVLACYGIQTAPGWAIRIRYVAVGAATTPLGGIGGPSVFASTLLARTADIAGIVFPPTTSPVGINPFGFVRKNNTVQSQSPELWANGHPDEVYNWLRTDVSATWQNMSRLGIQDSTTSPLVSGTLYVFRARVDSPTTWRYMYFDTGAASGVTTTHCWGLYMTTAFAEQTSGITADVTTSLAASSQVKLDFGTTVSKVTQTDVYFGICIVGTTMPSLIGKPCTALDSIRAPILCGPSTASLTTPGSFTSPAATPTVGGTFVPHVVLSTS